MLIALLITFSLITGIQTPAVEDTLSSLPEVTSSFSDCLMSDKERQVFSLLTEHPQQQRSGLVCSKALNEFARQRAEDMRTRGYFGHINPDRIGPNALLKEFGYPLPSSYTGHLANNIESIAGGYSDPTKVIQVLLDSKTHRVHLLGEQDFYLQQNEIGIAHVRDKETDYEDYWVIVIARQKTPEDKKYICTPEPSLCFVLGK